jgi:hypothetical protein
MTEDRRLQLDTPPWTALGYAGRSTTHRAANLAGESLRQVNHSLGTLQHASEVYDLVASLAYVLERMPQALDGMRDWLKREQNRGTLDVERGRDLETSIATVLVAMAGGSDTIEKAAVELRAAHNAMAFVLGPLTAEERAERRGGG